MNQDERATLILRAKLLGAGGFYRCPNTGKILVGLTGDDKVICPCGKSNPRVPEERTERTGVHIVRFLNTATAEEYIDSGNR